MRKNIITIRAHHLLCMLGFQGYGYNEAFTANLKKIIEYIGKDNSTEIRIVDTGDIICLACPHNRNRLCQKNENSAREIQNMDLKVLKKLDLENKTIIKPKDVFSLIDEKIKTPKDKRDICGNCEWQDKCLWHIGKRQMY
ncbi:MAG: DUF1284 domain-containing protein [Elusimicrobia bacterium]|nr:DUF1284 domain-containing protein [Elusimicrobiota bacterium]